MVDVPLDMPRIAWRSPARHTPLAVALTPRRRGSALRTTLVAREYRGDRLD
jgi:hypothetical protein